MNLCVFDLQESPLELARGDSDFIQTSSILFAFEMTSRVTQRASFD